MNAAYWQRQATLASRQATLASHEALDNTPDLLEELKRAVKAKYKFGSFKRPPLPNNTDAHLSGKVIN